MAMRISASTLASQVDDEMAKHVALYATVKEETKRGTAVILIDMRRVHGLEQLDKFPIPGAAPEGYNGPNWYSKYKSTIIKTDGTKGEGVGDWYNDYYDDTPDGVALRQQIDAHLAGKTTAESDVKWIAEKDRLNAQRNNRVNSIKNAVSLHQQMMWIKNETDNADVKFITDDVDGVEVITRSNKNIWLFNTNDGSKSKVISTGQFLAMDLDKARKIADDNKRDVTYADVIAAGSRGTRGGITASKFQTPKTTNEFDSATASYATYLVEQQNDADKRRRLLTYLNSDKSDTLLLSLEEIRAAIDNILSQEGIAKRLDILIQQGGLKAALEKKAVA